MAASHYILVVNFLFSKSFKALTKNLPWRLFIPFLKYQVMKTLKHSLRTLCSLIIRRVGKWRYDRG